MDPESRRVWDHRRDQLLHTVAHEWAHGWQSWLGALDIHHQPLGNALNEGIAEYLAYSVLIEAGLLTREVVEPFMLGSAYGSQELDGPIRDIENDVWSGHTGFLAIDWLVDEAPSGRMALRTLAELIGDGATVADAFRTAFNVELESFYTQFEAWRQIILDDVQRLRKPPEPDQYRREHRRRDRRSRFIAGTPVGTNWPLLAATTRSRAGAATTSSTAMTTTTR